MRSVVVSGLTLGVTCEAGVPRARVSQLAFASNCLMSTSRVQAVCHTLEACRRCASTAQMTGRSCSRPGSPGAGSPGSHLALTGNELTGRERLRLRGKLQGSMAAVRSSPDRRSSPFRDDAQLSGGGPAGFAASGPGSTAPATWSRRPRRRGGGVRSPRPVRRPGTIAVAAFSN